MSSTLRMSLGVVLALALGSTPAAQAVLTRTEAHYTALGAFSASFTLRYTVRAYRQTATSTGTATFESPGMMKLAFGANAGVCASDGTTIRSYSPDEHTMSVRPLSSSPYALFTSLFASAGTLASTFEFAVEPGAPGATTTVLVGVAPSSTAEWPRARLETDNVTSDTLTAAFTDRQGNVLRLELAMQKRILPLPMRFFVIVPPKGTTII